MTIFGKKYTKAEVALFLLVMAQILYLLIYNLLRTKYAVNFDSSEYMIQAMQIWNQKTLLIEDYYYSTMLTWDMPTFLAVLFYGLTGDIFLAWGMANNVLIILFCLVLFKLCRDLEYKGWQTGVAFFCIFAMYQYGPVDYMEELFINGALYGFRILFMLAFMDLMICMHKGKKSLANIFLYLLAFAGVFVCGLSTGIFAIGCCLLPVFVGEIWQILLEKKLVSLLGFFRKPVVVMGAAMVVSLMGVVVNYLLGFSGSAASQKMTILPAEMGDNLINIFVGLFELLGWPRIPVSIASISGLLGIAAAFVTVCYLGAMALTLCVAFARGRELKESQHIFAIQTAFVILINVALFVFADLTYSTETFEYRYWVIVLVPLFISLGFVLEWLGKRVAVNLRRYFSLGFVLLLLGITVAKDYGCFIRTTGNEIFEPVMQDVNQRGLDEVFVYSDWASSRVMCAYANRTTEYFAVCDAGTDDTGMHEFTDSLRMPRWGTYVKYDKDCTDMEEEKSTAIVIADWLGEKKDFYARRATEQIPYEGTGYTLLLMDRNYMDFVYGVPEMGKTHSRDYFNWQYDRSTLTMNENGEYQSNGQAGVLLSGTFAAGENASFGAQLQYDVIDSSSSVAGMLTIEITGLDGSVRTVEQPLRTSDHQATIDSFSLAQGETYTVRVTGEEGAEIVLKRIDYYRN